MTNYSQREHPYWREIWLVGAIVIAIIIYCYGTGIWTHNWLEGVLR